MGRLRELAQLRQTFHIGRLDAADASAGTLAGSRKAQRHARARVPEAFLDRESLLTLVAKRSLPAEAAEDAGAGDLAGGLADASKTVTILYTSDTGHAEECAKALRVGLRFGGSSSDALRTPELMLDGRC